MRRALLAGWLAVLAAPGLAQEEAREAARRYDEGDFEAAAAGFRALLADETAGLDRGALHYNLGNAEFRSGRLGYAMLHWERALRQHPNDADALANLALARGVLERRSTEAAAGAPGGLSVEMLRRAEGFGSRLRRVPPGRYAAFFCAAALGAGVLVTLLRFVRRRRLPLVGLVLALAAAAVSGALLAFRVTAPELAVVVRPGAALRSGPGDSFPQLAALPEGFYLELGGAPDAPGGFRRVVAAGIVGYADPASVLPIAEDPCPGENGQNGGDDVPTESP